MHELNLFPEWKTVQFDSFSDLGSFIGERKGKRRWSIIQQDSSDWNNNVSFDKAIKQMLYGYDFDQRLVEGLKDFTDEDVIDRGGLNMDVEGSVYDMGAVIQGVPECCISDTRVEEKKHVRLVCSCGFSWSVDSDHILNRSIAVANLIGTLMTKGYVVDLDFIDVYNAHSRGKSVFFVRIPTGSFCASTIAFLNSPQFLRRITIAVNDFILDYDICGDADGFKSEDILNWCKKNTLYFEDGYDMGNDNVKKLYGTLEKAEETINKLYNEWLNREKS